MKTKRKKKAIKKVNISYFLCKLYKDLKENPEIFQICKLRAMHGDCDYEKIRIDYRKDLYATLIHEYLHYIYPDFSETKVLLEERRIINKMSLKQIKNLIKAFSDIFK